MNFAYLSPKEWYHVWKEKKNLFTFPQKRVSSTKSREKVLSREKKTLLTADYRCAFARGGDEPSARPLHPPWAKRIGTFWFSFLFKGISGGQGKISSFKNSLRTKNKNIKNIAKTRFALKISYTNRLSNSRRIDWHNQFENRGRWVKLDFYRNTL